VRTIQRIETGKEPKGHTLRVIAQALKVKGKELLSMSRTINRQYSQIK
jgi:hypothetical protein